MNNRENLRFAKLANEIFAKLDFSLSGLTVLTEVGSNLYIYNPLIPLICGAKKVFAIVKDTQYGRAEEIKDQCYELADFLGFRQCIEIATNVIDESWISQADIITNSGMLRPIDRKLISKFKNGAVLPLMFEAWELREQDIDLGACKDYKIPIAGTWENHPDLKVFDYVEILCLKMAFEAGFEVRGNNIFIWSDDHFGDKIYNSFLKNGANKCFLSVDELELLNVASMLDFIFIADYDEKRNYFDLLRINLLIKKNPHLAIVHLYGNIKVDEFEKVGVSIFPKKNGRNELMTFTLAHVGIKPYINLQVGGYKVAYCLINGLESDLIQRI